MSPLDYIERFGVIRQDMPFGRDIWTGLARQLLESYVRTRDGWRFLHALSANTNACQFRLGWFRAPCPFSKRQAKLPVTRDQVCGQVYPACFVMDMSNPDLHGMACLAIVIKASRMWYVHPTRVVSLSPQEQQDVMERVG